MESGRSNPEFYHQQLDAVAAQIAAFATSTAIIGSHMARFVYAKKGSRAVHLSWAEDGVLLEYWDGDDNVRDVIEPSWKTAIHDAHQWLL